MLQEQPELLARLDLLVQQALQVLKEQEVLLARQELLVHKEREVLLVQQALQAHKEKEGLPVLQEQPEQLVPLVLRVH